MRAAPGTVSGLFAGRYSIERALGEGATATVFLARDTQAGLSVAIKMLRPELGQSAASSRFLKEIKRTAALNHPRILPVLDSGDHEGQMYLVLPYMEGGTLRDRLKREKQLPVDEAIALVRPIAEALDYAHKQGLIHRDVKPENILFTGGEPVLGDFGIARALEIELGETSTSTGIVRGTPAYMSPEQASGSMDYDGRSDIYSLGCVLYEMLAGVPAFIGPTPEAVIAQRFAYPPRELRVYRPSVSPAMESAIAKALTIAPADRYRTSNEFAEALGTAMTATTAVSSAGSAQAGRRPIVAAMAMLAIVVVTGMALWLALGRSGVSGDIASSNALDTTVVAILPLERDDAALPSWRDEDLLHQALSRWLGVTVVDQFQVADAIRRGGNPHTIEHAARIASQLGAGRFIRGRITSFGGDRRVAATLFDAPKGSSLHSVAMILPGGLEGAIRTYERLADSLLLRSAPVDSASAPVAGVRSLPAAQAFGRAQAALVEWDLLAADSALQAATAYAPDYARATLWLAQVRVWQNQGRATWATLAERAVAMAQQFSQRERRLAAALGYLARGSYSDACATYDSLLSQNDHDFAAWFGRAQCQSLDKVVVPDPRSPSGWRFRSSAHDAMRAYGRAMTVLPSVHRGYERNAFQRLRVLLLLSNQLVVGYGVGDSAMFYARPGWIGDTLVLVPYPREVMVQGGHQSVPPGFARALANRREEFRRVAAGWSVAFPQSPGAKQAVSLSLEQLSDVAAIDTLRLARKLVGETSRKSRLAVAEVLLLAKFGIPDRPDLLDAARALGDSLLVGGDSSSAESARALAPVAVLLGDCDRAVELIRRGGMDQATYRFSASLYVNAQVLLIRSVMDCSEAPQMTLRDLALAIDRENAQRSATTSGLLDGLLLLRPTLFAREPNAEMLQRLSSSSNHLLVTAALHSARGESVRTREALTRAEADWVLGVPTPDFATATSMLWLSIADTLTATRVLDRVLGAVQGYEPDVLLDAGRTAGLIAAIRLRAQLAAARHDDAARTKWSDVARRLLSHRIRSSTSRPASQ